MSDLCKVWVVGVFFFFPLFFFRSAREITRVYSAFISLRCFSLRCFSAGFFFFHGGVPACFSVQVRDAVGIGKAHPTALKMEVEDK